MYDFKKIERKWQKKWYNSGEFRAKETKKNKFYILEMLPYPSSLGLHMGHARNYVIGDVISRYKRMKGFDVWDRAGYDMHGLPAEQGVEKKLNLKNVEFVNWLPLEKLATEIAKAKISLGIFSKSEKANVVIPNKVYDALATKKAVISASTKAMAEIINSNPGSIILVDKDNSEKLAQKLEDLLGDSVARRKYAINGYKLYKKIFTPEKVVKNLYKNFNNE